MEIKLFYFNPLRECCYVIWDETSDCVIVDPGCYDDREFSRLSDFVSEKGLRPVRILLTHGHFDHVFGLSRCVELWHPVVNIHGADICQTEMAPDMAGGLGLDFTPLSCHFTQVCDGDKLAAGNMQFEVLHTPGHSAGSVCYRCSAGGILFSGDTLFAGGIGRTDLPGGDSSAIMRSISTRLAVLPPETAVLPGHGYPTTIKDETASNPYLKSVR
ncbi:MAG: MBL fold metallo-hydrolase [Bacteroidales bacterium]|nr:MBL fold metallo-hydrolase [Bacteroidales bacterium]